jgi:hypothetical protein
LSQGRSESRNLGIQFGSVAPDGGLFSQLRGHTFQAPAQFGRVVPGGVQALAERGNVNAASDP